MNCIGIARHSPLKRAALMLMAAVTLTGATEPGQSVPQPAAAPANSATQSDRPDFSGFWSLSRTQHPFDPELVAKLPPNTVMVDDTGGAEFPPGEYGGLKPKPEALAAAQQWKAEDDMTISRVCERPSIIYGTQGPFPIEIYQGTEFIILKYEYFDMVRIVFMDGRQMPPDAPHSKTGHSVGYWDGDELVIETTHLAAATITNNGLNHSDEARVLERLRLDPDGKTLRMTQWFTDPATLENNGARYIEWKREPGQHVYPYDCDPIFAVGYEAQ